MVNTKKKKNRNIESKSNFSLQRRNIDLVGRFNFSILKKNYLLHIIPLNIIHLHFQRVCCHRQMAIMSARFNCRLRPFTSINVANAFYFANRLKRFLFSTEVEWSHCLLAKRSLSYHTKVLSFIIPSSSLRVATTKASLGDSRARRVFMVLLIGT